MIPPIFKDINPEFLNLIGMDGVTWKGKELLVITGANASGKSLARRLFQVFVKKRGFEVIHLSQEGRGAGGFARVFVYGSEGDEATGTISAKTLVKGFRTSRNHDNEHLMIYDEPEIGMSEEAAMGAAEFLRDQLADRPPNLLGVVVMTHSRHFVSVLKDAPRSQFINLGGEYATADDWLGRPIKPIPPQQLMDAGLEKRRAATKLFNRMTSEQ